jgi:hypothetical protein
MPTAQTPDPLSQVYGAIFGALQAWPPLQSSNTGIIRKWYDLRDPAWRTTDPLPSFPFDAGDLPAAWLTQEMNKIQPYGSNSQIADLSLEYPLLTATDTLQVVDQNWITTNVMVAMMQSSPTDNLGLEQFVGWTGGVRTWEIKSSSMSAAKKAITGGEKRASARCSIYVSAYLSRDFIRGLTKLP